MNDQAGSLLIAARRSGDSTVLDRVRYDGISRCSRAFRDGRAARVVLSQLGPGVMRGDTVTLEGRVLTDAHLIVTSQTSTRVLGGAARASSQARWSVAAGGVLELIGEPLVAAGDARFDSTTTIELAAGAVAVISEVAGVPASADVRLRTSIGRDGRELFYDAFAAATAAPDAVGTFAVVGLDDERISMLVSMLDQTADTISSARIGIGILRGGIFARVLGPDCWTVRSILIALRHATWRTLPVGVKTTQLSSHEAIGCH